MGQHRRLLVTVAVLVALTGIASASPPLYRAVPIPGIPSQGYNTVFPADINNHGVVVGTLSRLSGFVPVRAFLWDGVNPTIDLGDLGVYEFSAAVGINDAGQVIGYAEVVDSRSSTGHSFHGFFWESGRITDLPPITGDRDSQALAITEGGEVLVVSYDRNDRGQDRYYVWKDGKSDQIGRLASYPGGPSAFAFSMNDARQIVGAAIFADGQQRAFLWQNGTMTDLGLAPGDDFYSAANKITNGGLIVGESWAYDDQNGHGARGQGAVWQLGTFVRTIPPLGGDWALSALSANESGTVVGYSGFPSSAVVSFGSTSLDLNDLVPGKPPDRWLYQGRDVNDLGQIVVDGQFGCCGYLLNP